MRFQATLDNSQVSKVLAKALRHEGVEVSDYNALEVNADIFLEHFGAKKIQAIKNIRLVAPLSLKDAKDLYEAVAKEFDPLKHLPERKRYALRRAEKLVEEISRDLKAEHFDGALQEQARQLLTQVDKLVK